MGWGLKIGFLLVGLAFAALGGWIIAIPLFVLLFLSLILNRRSREKRGRKEPSGRQVGPSVLSIVGALLILLSIVALLGGGTLSPIILAVGGFALLLRHRISFPFSTGMTPVKDSILLRHKLSPFRWSALAEAKVSTRDMEGAMSSLNERLYFTSNPKPRIFLVFSASSFSRTKAEKALISRIQSSARLLVPQGVYLLPLDSAEAVGNLGVCASRIEPSMQNLRQHISAADYTDLVVETHQGFVTRFETYARSDQGSKFSPALSPLRIENTPRLTLREFLHEAREKLGSPQPDRYTAFLSSMAATEGEALGQRITETAQGRQEQFVVVASVGNPSVELSRAQLQAITSVYQ